jgi:hypothetical protein
MRVTKNMASQYCAVCGRHILMGEKFSRFFPSEGEPLVAVCPLCSLRALELGWIKEGSPTTPVLGSAPRRRGLLATLLGTGRRADTQPIVEEPVLERLSDNELATVEAADAFNASPFRRTIGGLARSLGEPHASIVTLSGVNPEMVITIAWELSWYQYRVSLDWAQPIRLAERGHELEELAETFKNWNARIEEDGRLVPQLAAA